MSSPAITKVFLPLRFLLGLAVALAGAGLLASVFLFGDRISIRLLLFGTLLIAIGAGVALSARADACSSCRKALFDSSTSVPIEQHAHLAGSVRALAPGNADGLIQLCSGPFPRVDAPLRSTVLVAFCPACRAVARVASCQEKLLPDGGTTTHDLAAHVLLTGPDVARLVDALEARNRAWTQVAYGHAG